MAIPFLPPPAGRPEVETDEAPAETVRLRDALLATAAEGDGRVLCARLLDYHRREARPGWWWYFRRLRMTDKELVDDSQALGCLEHDRGEPVDLSITNPRAKSLEWSFTFLPQQHQFDEGDGGEDPREDGSGWTVSGVDNATGSIRLRRSRDLRDAPLPTSLVPGGPIGTKAQQAALRRVAASLVAGHGAYRHPGSTREAAAALDRHLKAVAS